MNNDTPAVKSSGTLAGLKNVLNCYNLVNRLIDRPSGVPGLGVMHGESGIGKSYATIYAQNKTRAIRVEVGESWTKAVFLKAVLREGGVPDPKGTVASLAEQAIMLLGDDPRRPLIIDEADKLVDKKMIELVRELHEHSQVPILLVGEEQLPKKLMLIERVHNRVLDWLPAARCDLEDCRKLAVIFLPGVVIDDALLDHVRLEGDGRARRIVVTLTNMAEWARNRGLKAVDRGTYDGRIHTGRPPARRDVPTPLLKLAGGAA